MSPNAVRVRTASGWQDIALQGPQGQPGPSGLGVYEQPGDPGVTTVGTVWIDTDAAPPVSPPTPVPVATTLPASPYDGQQSILVDNVTTPLYMWQMRYSSAVGKWLYVGGSGPQLFLNTSESTTVVGAWTDLATVGPSFVIPRSGAYFVWATAVMLSNADRDNLCLGIAIGAAASVLIGAWTDTLANLWNQAVITPFGVNFTAGQEVRVRYYQSVASTMQVFGRSLYVTPFTIT